MASYGDFDPTITFAVFDDVWRNTDVADDHRKYIETLGSYIEDMSDEEYREYRNWRYVQETLNAVTM